MKWHLQEQFNQYSLLVTIILFQSQSNITKQYNLRLVQTGCVKRIRLGAFYAMQKTHPDRKDPIYCVLCSKLRRSEQAFRLNIFTSSKYILQMKISFCFFGRFHPFMWHNQEMRNQLQVPKLSCWAVVVSQLLEWLPQTLDVRGSNPVIGNLL